ncbi:MAG: efflux RND transporter periplasmic adaptor subunit [Rhizobiaceae bacterium]|nr:efflux RND transporter periplasmic adaptor subunit [Rhizobiaceae bacterium]MCO5071401.1 efflux RND transporter periplasmic adaptor subunit [Rhizobiaceae bacterium]
MAKFKLHKVAAVAVLIGFAAWMGTGKFSSVGSAAPENGAAPTETAKPAEEKTALRTVAVIVPPRIQHSRAIRISGRTEAEKRAVLATRVMGVIERLAVKEGDHVKRGDLILSLDAEDKVAAIKMAESMVTQRQAEADAAERLVKGGNAPKLQADQARAALAAAKSQEESAKTEFARSQIFAPFNGLIDRVHVERGSGILAGTEVATLINLDPLLAIGEVSERDLQFLKLGSEADIELVDGTKVKGTLRYISRDATSATRTFRIEVAIPNEDKKLPSGMTAEITVHAAPEEAVVLPRSVVTLSNNGDLGIRAVDKESRIVFYPIDLLDDMPNGFVLGGIPADAQVVVAGQDLVSDGDLVTAVAADEAMLKRLANVSVGTN